ncbi:MAG: hypothetical protein DCC56_02740 [Anaerolineae bacterium]|nr:MAG: hypothetical protein DCC56_02740 [Anaerolineae bacterium]WKZ44245.1 MAG: hypothetical protein QY302_00475 [Anaerolineales bacterium]
MNFNFGEVLTRAWQIIWKHKILWVFGILASCGQGGSNFNMNSSGGGGNGNGIGQPPDLPPQMMRWLQSIEQNLTTFFIITIALVCVIGIVALLLSSIGKIGLIRGASQADGGAEALVLGELFSGSMPYLWRIVGLSVIISIPALIFAAVIFVVLIGGLLVGKSNDSMILVVLGIVPIAIGGACLLVPINFVLGMIFRQAENAAVLENLGVFPAISRGWEIFKGNLGPIILMAIILGVIGFVLGIVIAIPFLVLIFPAVMGIMLTDGQSLTPLYLMGICFCLLIPIMWLLQGIITSYTESVWTLTYLRLTKKKDDAPVLTEANA